MAKIIVKSKVKKVKRKFPVDFIAPEFLNSRKLGTSNISDLKTLVGKTTKINLMYLTGKARNQNISLVFRVIEVSSGVAKTQIKRYQHIPYYLRRFIKVGTNLMEDSYVVKSKDGIEIRIKPFLVTKVKTSKMILSTLRIKCRELIKDEVLKVTYDEFIASVVNGKEQNLYKNELKKITPIKLFEFKKVEIN